MLEKLPDKSKIAENEEKILDFWQKNDIFKKTLEKPSPKGEYVFYDGPPFATGEPHYGHVVPGTIKDIIPRYKTMRGYRVRRRWGWDCHGLPVENIVEKELNLKIKKDILDYGIGKFNAMARQSVMRYADDWRRVIPRLGRWVDMEDDYRTMDARYTESVWWAFSELYKKGLIYEGFKSMNLCPRCETTLSNFEVSQSYKDITDISIYVKFKLKDSDSYLLAWTTTPWTLPGNTALAINPSIEYVRIEVLNTKLIIAKSRLAVIKSEYKILENIKAKDLIGKPYEPVFEYYSDDKKLKNRTNGWKVYGADFVNVENGTGIVHIAPAFGSDDHDLSLKHDLPFIQHVGMNGKFKSEIIDFSEQDVKPKANHQKADIEIIKYLAHKNFLFAKEKIVHSYPHCWRCDTPLLNYASSSWFVKVTAMREKLVKENKKIKWIPPEIGESRFGNWLLGARDWSISRSRFWGAPLPVWREEKTDKQIIIGSVSELKKYSHPKNRYYVCRHGEADNNARLIVSSIASNEHHLTAKGKKQVDMAAKWFMNKKIDLIFSSPFLRTRETAEIIANKIGLDKSKIIVEEKIHELSAGVWEGKDFNEFTTFFSEKDRFTETPENGENYSDIKKRVGDFVYSLEYKYKDKNILIISHDVPLFLLETIVQGLNKKQSMELRGKEHHYNQNAKPHKLDFYPLPHNEEYELELHRPFIDELELFSEKGNKLERIPEVFDCWFESGSMPFAESHYPFLKDDFNPKPGPFSKILGKTKGYPADFIAEGLDQTRGWFYSMLVLGTALFGKSPYKRVVVNGLVLAEDGQKMAKSKKNFPDLMSIVNKYSADALRYFLMSSPLMKAQDFSFSEKGVGEVAKKLIGRLDNVLSFYEMYATFEISDVESSDPLDIWILNRLNELTGDITEGLEKYEIDKASRPIADFIDDLSTWYIRRSRERFKGEDKMDKEIALSTTKTVLLNLSKLIAPFMPFLAEDIYRRVHGQKESVHMEEWPEFSKPEKNVLENMRKVRKIASLGLDARMKAMINVRQPLSKLTIKSKISDDLAELIKNEVNVKDLIHDGKMSEEVALDTNITPELKEEGTVREFIRTVQDLRKEKGFTVVDRVVLTVQSSRDYSDLILRNKNMISSATLLKEIIIENIDFAEDAKIESGIRLDITK